MQTKRSRISSFGDSDATTGGALKKLSAELESPQSGILTVSSPVVIEKSVHGRLASFLEKCHLCWKWISEGDVFMYGYMRGFCSPECRDKQFVIENFDKPYGISAADFAKEKSNVKDKSAGTS
ncbi:hypothetical protein EZV62_013620 [Acer yangbiense]|uniref:FLZ-type domain-containing protein n=1 Tax=Acer yangbiense TaxID=1000413 RepID=A0A5C7HYV5_9ROSI|nr:hypothetical protein EZV62_013620 [Acer yangbiense]